MRLIGNDEAGRGDVIPEPLAFQGEPAVCARGVKFFRGGDQFGLRAVDAPWRGNGQVRSFVFTEKLELRLDHQQCFVRDVRRAQAAQQGRAAAAGRIDKRVFEPLDLAFDHLSTRPARQQHDGANREQARTMETQLHAGLIHTARANV